MQLSTLKFRGSIRSGTLDWNRRYSKKMYHHSLKLEYSQLGSTEEYRLGSRYDAEDEDQCLSWRLLPLITFDRACLTYIQREITQWA